jgi:hypothetical protein
MDLIKRYLNYKMKESIIKSIFLLLILFVPAILTAQTDTLSSQGTIKILKPKDGKVFIKAKADFGRMGVNSFQPFPVVEGYSFPFNYTRYFSEHFKGKSIQLNNNADTVYLEITITKKGKTTIKDITSSMTNGRRAFFDADNKKEKSDLQVYSFHFLNEIKQWFPGYDMTTEISSYKGQQVIRPVKTNRNAIGIITIMFSNQSFDN